MIPVKMNFSEASLWIKMRECIIFCVNAKFVDLFQARFEHLLRGLFQHGKTQNDPQSLLPQTTSLSRLWKPTILRTHRKSKMLSNVSSFLFSRLPSKGRCRTISAMPIMNARIPVTMSDKCSCSRQFLCGKTILACL